MSSISSGSVDNSQKSWTFLDGSRRTVAVLDSVAIGRGRYLPGWQWSQHVKPQTEKESEAHVGYVISGQMTVKAADGEEVTVGPGDAFQVGPGADAWVKGTEPCITIDFEIIEGGGQI